MATQFAELYQKMSPSQRGTLIVLPLLIVTAFGILIYNGQSSSYVALSWGKVFTHEELKRAEQALLDANLDDFRTEGLRIFVPKNDVDRYNAALVEVGSLPDNWAAEWQKQYENSSMFSSKQQLDQNREIARYNVIARMVRLIPGIEHADVITARPEFKGYWGGDRPRVTATVSVRPKRNHELTGQQIQSIRAAVAGGIPDLRPADVTVFDQSTAIAHSADDEASPFDSGLLTRIKHFEKMHSTTIRSHLNYIPGVNVSVHVDLENLKSSTERSQRVDSKTVTLQSDTRNISRESSQSVTSAEPGQRSNVPTQLNTQSGPSRVENFTDEAATENSLPTSVTTSEKVYLAAMPESVQVAVSIPEDYYHKVVLKKGPPDGLSDADLQEFESGRGAAFRTAVESERTRVETAVKNDVSKLLPSGTPADAVVVSSIVRVDPEIPEVNLPVAEQITQVVSQWAGPLALGIFALWALRAMIKSMPKVEGGSTEALEAALQKLKPLPSEEEDLPTKKKKQATPREVLQATVRDNPELAATVLRKWIKAAK